MRIRAGLVAFVLLLPVVAVSPAAGSAPGLTEDPARGLHYQGMRKAGDGPCAGRFELRTSSVGTLCTHGPDPAPPGVDVRVPRPPAAVARAEGSPTVDPVPPPVLCAGDGTSGARVQLVYAWSEGKPDRYDAYAASFQLWAREVDRIVAASAAETGGSRRIRFVHDAACQPVVSRVMVPAGAQTDWQAMVSGLIAAGYDSGDRKYLVWMDATWYCGLGSMLGDDRPGPENGHNQGPPLYARIDSGCWGLSGSSAEAHELIHNLGGVQLSAPHSTGAYHCTDDYDLMCYPDGPNVTMTTPCPPSHTNLLDCNADDYFNTTPAPGSYLDTHWNLARSRFLAGPPGAPSGVQAVAGEGVATLTWAAPPTDGNAPVTGYAVTARPDGGGPGTTTTFPTVATTQPVAGLANGTTYTFQVAAVNGAGTGPSSTTSQPVTPTIGSGYHPLSPARILDTRSGNGTETAGPVASATALQLQVAGRGGVPATGVSAVVLNVTVTDPQSAGYVTAWPTGEARPAASNLNVGPGSTVANLAVVKLGTGGRVSLYNGAGPAHLIADVAGWYGVEGEGDPAGAGYHAVMPARILDTRSGDGAPAAKIPTATAIDVQVTGRAGVPQTGVGAVALTVTVTQPEGAGYVTAWPAGDPRPLASNLNFEPGRTVANLVIVKVGAGGQISLFNGGGGGSHLVADVAGWYGEGASGGGSGGGARFHALSPTRVLDSRTGNGLVAALVGFKTTVDVPLSGRGGVPPDGVSAIVLNVTVVDPAIGGYLTAWPAGELRPLASNVNFADRATVPDLVVVRPGTSGAVSLFLNGGGAHLLADAAGWFGTAA